MSNTPNELPDNGSADGAAAGQSNTARNGSTPAGRGNAKSSRMRTPIIVVAILAILTIALVSTWPTLYAAFMGPGLRVDGIHTEDAQPASTDTEGEWSVVNGTVPNASAVGFTFHEILPGEVKETSGTTTDVSGKIVVSDEQLVSGHVEVDMTNISTDQERRDINVRRNLLETEDFPTATFEVTEPVDISDVPDDGTMTSVTVPGELTIHGVTNSVSPTFDVLRTGDQILIAGDIEISRVDYGVETPDFIAAKVDEQGQINLRLALEK